MRNASLLSDDLFSYMNQNIKKLKDLISEIHDMLLDTGVFDSRYADQHAPIIAAFYLIDQKLSLVDLIALVCKTDVQENQESDSDQQDFYESFLNVLIREGQEDKTLLEILADYTTSGVDRKKYLSIFLNRYGIEYKESKKAFFIGKNQNMTNIMAKQTKYKNYYAQMKDNKFFNSTRNASGSKRGFDFNLSK
jgi:hypothetical protein